MRAMGPRWTYQRLQGIVENRLGSLARRLPNASWSDFDVDVPVDEFRQRRIWPIDIHASRRVAIEYPDADLARRVGDLIGGELSLFSGRCRSLGWPPDWHLNADDECRLTAQNHFSRLSTFGHGDIKNFWEPGRFGFVWLLGRAHCAGVIANAAELFFQALGDFVDKNPPYRGPQWMCGQEAALRAVTIAGGWSLFGASATDEDVRNVTRLFSATANRIAVHLDYALSQKNNHGLSEAMGLLVIGLALPEHADATQWIQTGRTTLEREAAALVDADGGFSQQSANYHRVMIHDLVAAVTIAAHHGMELPGCRAALDRSSRFLHSMMVRHGRQPRYGHDDGACVLDWTSCAYDDFRPALQEASFASGRDLPIEPGPWDAGLPWLGCSAPETMPRQRLTATAKTIHHHAGLAVLRGRDRQGAEQYAAMRVPPAVYRPSQVDAMHVDVWIDGCNVAIDPGTYRYNADGQWSTIPLALGSSHNVIGSEGHDLARRVGRFLYVPWPKVRIAPSPLSVPDSDQTVGGIWDRPIGGIQKWTRTMEMTEGGVVIRDRVSCRSKCPVELRWHLADGEVIDPSNAVPHQAVSRQAVSRQAMSQPAGQFQWKLPVGVVQLGIEVDCSEAKLQLHHERASEQVAGWFAPRYGELAPCHRVVAEIVSGTATELTITSRFRLVESSANVHSNFISSR